MISWEPLHIFRLLQEQKLRPRVILQKHDHIQCCGNKCFKDCDTYGLRVICLCTVSLNSRLLSLPNCITSTEESLNEWEAKAKAAPSYNSWETVDHSEHQTFISNSSKLCGSSSILKNPTKLLHKPEVWLGKFIWIKSQRPGLLSYCPLQLGCFLS